ncbi:MAG TPA: hypothetical protein PK467_04530 [Candidatus Wallbacteria bacterium]|nr:hypothetical protein [Candidatus Wallbacteria bacterium]
MDFKKCPGCGAEIELDNNKCPVCGSAIADSFGGRIEESDKNSDRQTQFSKKSAFATSGAVSSRQQPYLNNTAQAYEHNAKPPISVGTAVIIGVLTLAGLAVAFVVSCVAAFIGGAQIIDSLGRPRPEEFVMPIVFGGFAFIVASSFSGLAIGYNAGAYICMAAGTTKGRILTLIPMLTMGGYYLASFTAALAVSFLGFAAGGRFIFSHTIYYFNIILCILICGYITNRVFKPEE